MVFNGVDSRLRGCQLVADLVVPDVQLAEALDTVVSI
jgi:hypothetical protein